MFSEVPQLSEIKDLSQLWGAYYQQSIKFWNKLHVTLPDQGNDNFQFDQTIDVNGVNLVAQSKVKENPRYCDLDIPIELKEVIDLMCIYLGGNKSDLLTPCSVYFDIFKRYPVRDTDIQDLLKEVSLRITGPTDPLNTFLIAHKRDPYVILRNLDRYDEWFYKEWNKWWIENPQYELAGYSAMYSPRDAQLQYAFSFNPKKELKNLSIKKAVRLNDIDYPPRDIITVRIINEAFLRTHMHFFKGRMTRLVQSAPNGYFFEDPKGPMDQIYPYTWLDMHYHYHDIGEHYKPEATVNHWNTYLDMIHKGLRVLNPDNLHSYKYISEQEALVNLRKWQRKIYYSFPQGFHLRKNNTASGFTAESGYLTYSKYGPIITNNSNAYRHLSQEDSINWLIRNDPF